MDRKQVLVLTNAITDEEIGEIKRAFCPESGQQTNVNLHLVHVIPRLPTCYFNIPAMGMLVERYYDEATHSLNHIGNLLNVEKKNQWLINGKLRTEVLRLANKLGSSFILASAEQIKELQRSLFFKQIHQCATIRNMKRDIKVL